MVFRTSTIFSEGSPLSCCGPQEVAWLSTATLTCCTLVLSLQYVFSSPSRFSPWRALRWELTSCQVLETGISYVGDCEEDRRKPFEYENCIELLGEHEEGCEIAAGEAYNSIRQLRGPGKEAACSDAFVPWALVHAVGGHYRPSGKIQDGHICAYRTGVLEDSETEVFVDAAHTASKLRNNSNVACWYLDIGSRPGRHHHMVYPTCSIVSLQDPQTLREVDMDDQQLQLQGRAHGSAPPRSMLMYLAIISGMSSLLSVATLQWCIRTSLTRWDDLRELRAAEPDGLMQQGAGRQDKDKASSYARQHDVRNKWDVFQQSVLGEYRLVPTGEETDTSVAPARKASEPL